jgi:hypothetical protein
MKIAKLLFKPKWQDKDPALRRAAVSADDDIDLAAALPEIARRDADAGVRLAALQRLGDYEAWRERSTGDADEHVRRAAREAYLTLLCAGGANGPALSRRIAELETLAEIEIERVATSAADSALRREALARVAKPALIAQRAVADPDSAVRLILVERISDPALLERIAERARKTDKTVSRRARELLQVILVEAGDATAIVASARRLCERVEILMRGPHGDAPAELVGIESEWNALGGAVPLELSTRFRGAHALARQAFEEQTNPRPPLMEPAPEVAPAPPTELPPQADPALAADAAKAKAHARERHARHKAQRHDIDKRLSEFAAALDTGDSALAHRLHGDIERGIAELDTVPDELRGKLDEQLVRYAEMKRWQHWSNNQRRRALCAAIESTIDSGMHPDAVATRVREAREEWQRLNAAQGIADDTQAGAGISRRFHGLCQRVLRPTNAYFAKRKEVRQSHAEQIDALLTSAAAIGADSTDWKGIAEIRAQASSALRALDGVEARRRTELAKRLKEILARFAAQATAHERDVEAAKTRLIEQATALSGRGEDAAAPREVRELQKRWTALGNGRRAADQRQWREFRAACDAVFGKLDAARIQREAAAAGAREEAQRLLEEFAALAASPPNDAEAIRKQLRELDSRWLAVAADDRALLKRQREVREAIALQIRESARRMRLARFAGAMQKYTLLHQLESGATDMASGWEDLPACAEFDLPLADRRARAQAGPCPAAAADDTAPRSILVRLEFLAGIDSPPEDRQLRMSHQVKRLSSRMREGAAATPESELSDLMRAWFAQASQTQILEDRFAAAARAAMDSLP